MLFMVTEDFKAGRQRDIWNRLETRGRMVPAGLKYVDSWIEANFERCFQLMECEDPCLLQEWIAEWNDLVHFEVVPVVPSKQTREMMGRCRE